MTGGWADYSWVPAICLTSVMLIFLMDFGAERYVERKYGYAHSHGPNIEAAITTDPGIIDIPLEGRRPTLTHQQLHSGDQDEGLQASISAANGHYGTGNVAPPTIKKAYAETTHHGSDADTEKIANFAETEERAFRQQIAAFLILEFGVIFHSVIIGLNLGTAGDELYVAIPTPLYSPKPPRVGDRKYSSVKR